MDPMDRLRTLDETIAAKIEEDRRSGALRQVPGFGQPLPEEPAYMATPEEWRLPFKVLKDAGFVPPEVAMIRELATLRSQLACATSPADQSALTEKVNALALKIAVRMEQFKS